MANSVQLTATGRLNKQALYEWFKLHGLFKRFMNNKRLAMHPSRGGAYHWPYEFNQNCNYNPFNAINTAFSWSRTPEGYQFWERIAGAWRAYGPLSYVNINKLDLSKFGYCRRRDLLCWLWVKMAKTTDEKLCKLHDTIMNATNDPEILNVFEDNNLLRHDLLLSVILALVRQKYNFSLHLLNIDELESEWGEFCETARYYTVGSGLINRIWRLNSHVLPFHSDMQYYKVTNISDVRMEHLKVNDIVYKYITCRLVNQDDETDHIRLKLYQHDSGILFNTLVYETDKDNVIPLVVGIITTIKLPKTDDVGYYSRKVFIFQDTLDEPHILSAKIQHLALNPQSKQRWLS